MNMREWCILCEIVCGGDQWRAVCNLNNERSRALTELKEHLQLYDERI